MILANSSRRTLRWPPQPGQASEPGPTLHPGTQRRRPQGAGPHRRAPRARRARAGAQPGGRVEHRVADRRRLGRGCHARPDGGAGARGARRDVFQVARVDVALRRLLAPALYRREPLDALVASLVGDITFRDLKRRLLVNTTDLHSGMQVMWGLPGLLDARVADAVVASCALPGIFPPRDDRRPRVRGRRRGREPAGAPGGLARLRADHRGQRRRHQRPPRGARDRRVRGHLHPRARDRDADPDRGPAPRLERARRWCWSSPRSSTSRCSRSTRRRS